MIEDDWALNDLKLKANKLALQLDILVISPWNTVSFNDRINSCIDLCQDIVVKLVCLQKQQPVKQAVKEEDE